MKRITGVFIVGAIMLSGCSCAANHAGSTGSSANTAIDQDIQTVGLQSEIKNAELKTEEKEVVYWDHKKVKILERLDEFLDHASNNIKDQIRIKTTLKDKTSEIDYDGKIVDTQDVTLLVTELKYDGKRLYVTTKGETKEYEKIFVEKLFSKHYNGTFYNYKVEDAEGKQMLVLQITPKLAASLNL